ncbi:hypothetical protein DL96DRAFT_1775621 [Flagelloscypha sp. PMI_526]|nr:hypothetical protein DL96DRAFT_1775621 [Flagelloscypha sp. PMI_526]
MSFLFASQPPPVMVLSNLPSSSSFPKIFLESSTRPWTPSPSPKRVPALTVGPTSAKALSSPTRPHRHPLTVLNNLDDFFNANPLTHGCFGSAGDTHSIATTFHPGHLLLHPIADFAIGDPYEDVPFMSTPLKSNEHDLFEFQSPSISPIPVHSSFPNSTSQLTSTPPLPLLSPESSELLLRPPNARSVAFLRPGSVHRYTPHNSPLPPEVALFRRLFPGEDFENEEQVLFRDNEHDSEEDYDTSTGDSGDDPFFSGEQSRWSASRPPLQCTPASLNMSKDEFFST